MTPNEAKRRRLSLAIASAVTLMAALALWLAWPSTSALAPDPQLLRVMEAIGAEVIDQPVSERQSLWRLERPGAEATVSLAELSSDEVIFLNFWASWCSPCVQEMPSMVRMAEHFAGRPFKMVAVSYDEGWEEIEGFLARLEREQPGTARLTVLRDPSGEGQEPLRQTFGTYKLPETYVIYRGQILSRFINLRDWMAPNILSYFEAIIPKR